MERRRIDDTEPGSADERTEAEPRQRGSGTVRLRADKGAEPRGAVRKQRSDKGAFRLTARDEWVLRWIGEMMVIREDQLQRLLGRDAQRETKEEGKVHLGTAARVVERWTEAGLAKAARFYAKTPRYIWLTSRGQRDIGLPYRKAFDESMGLLRHYFYVNEARLYAEEKYGPDIRWVSERELFRLGQHIDGHYVDGIINFTDGDVIAVEVEASVKKSERTRQILLLLAEAYDNVTYFVLKSTRAAMERRIAELPEEIQESFQIRALDE